MKASETSLRNLLEGGKQFQIPLFQRPYSWKQENWETLWEDLMSLYNDDEKGFYFLGPIVTQAELGTADGISRYIVIDGQQRFTTLSILLAALRNYLKKSDRQMSEQIHEFFLINKYQKNDDIYKVLPTQNDCDAYKSIIDNKTVKAKHKESQLGQIHAAYKFFDGKLKKPFTDEDTLLDYAKFKNIILERLVLVNITSDNNDNPYLIFESLNNKGEELTQADLVRNYIFMKLPAEERDEVYNSEWLPLQESFKLNMKQKEYADELTKAFWFYLRKDGEAINEKAVYKSIKKRFDNSEIGVKAELQKLIQFTKYYQRFIFCDEEPEYRLRHWFRRLNRLDFKTCHIFLLNVYHEYEEEKLSLEKFELILLYLESYFVRRLFAGVSTKTLGTVFNSLYSEVKKADPDDLVNGLQQVLKSYDKNKVWPNDNDFQNGFFSETMYSNSVSDRAKLLLESLESYFTKEKVNPENLTVEHIMPQTLNKDWKTMLGANHTSVHKKWLHTLGNLTLTAYNSEMGNKPFAEKLLYFNNSNLSLNHYFRKISVWDEEAIKKRAEYLAGIAIKVWPR
ncbi:DUF262 domain-containing protein [Anabaena subtropica]|uniref:DUF262 domain-containing protein n=1 Tax=Anabaena subtropica FACHB-260 TaxID=2692884 RepID=A0ABR8CNV2_9NOST|nr:DUF262 domain-containing protein [Anabaena subtropica]MBD2344584.1 DUF262 domain-containing protein [Anabaena subtropica FACHB-260]